MSAAPASSRAPDAGAVSAMLARAVERLAPALLSAGKRRGHYWTCGSVDNEAGGSLFVHLSGPRAGNWQDSATGEFGDALDLIAATQCRGDLKAAYRWACAWLGLADGEARVRNPAPRPAARAEAEPDDDRRRRAALRIWLEARPSLAGTGAEAYLLARGIDLGRLGRQPRALRYHPGLRHAPSGRTLPAMVAAISDMDGAHRATHRTYLDCDGGAWRKARVESPKMVLGGFAGGSVRLWRGASRKPLREAPADDLVVIGEGIETCLSIVLAVPEYRVLCAVSLDNMGAIALPPQVTRVILAADNDTKPAARRAFDRAVSRHLDAGRVVRVARPEIGNDFNDTLQAWA